MKIIYIHIEVTAREYYSKLLLSYFAAKEGYTVIIGDILRFFKYNTNHKGIFHFKDIAPSSLNLLLFKKLKKSGFQITSIDEEGGIEYKNFDSKKSNSFQKLRFSNQTISLVDKVFTWGNFDHDSLLQEYKNFKNKIINTGNSRYDFCSSKLDFFFDQEKDLSEENNKKPILIVSDLGYAMSQKPIWDQFQVLREAYFKDDNLNNYEFELYENFANKTLFLGEFVKLIRKLVKDFPDEKFVLRPHPTESVSAWKKIVGEYKNLEINNDDTSIHWIRKSKLMIHNSCYTSLEASLLKKPIISFCPENCINFRKYFTAKIGIQNKDFLEVKKNLESFIKNEKIFDDNIQSNFNLVKDRIEFQEKLSSKSILEEWKTLDKFIEDNSKSRKLRFFLSLYLIKFLFFLRSFLKRSLNFLNIRSKNHSKFIEFNERLIRDDLDKLNKNLLTNVKGSFKVNKFDKNLCLVEFNKK